MVVSKSTEVMAIKSIRFLLLLVTISSTAAYGAHPWILISHNQPVPISKFNHEPCLVIQPEAAIWRLLGCSAERKNKWKVKDLVPQYLLRS